VIVSFPLNLKSLDTIISNLPSISFTDWVFDLVLFLKYINLSIIHFRIRQIRISQCDVGLCRPRRVSSKIIHFPRPAVTATEVASRSATITVEASSADPIRNLFHLQRPLPAGCPRLFHIRTVGAQRVRHSGHAETCCQQFPSAPVETYCHRCQLCDHQTSQWSDLSVSELI